MYRYTIFLFYDISVKRQFCVLRNSGIIIKILVERLLTLESYYISIYSSKNPGNHIYQGILSKPVTYKYKELYLEVPV